MENQRKPKFIIVKVISDICVSLWFSLLVHQCLTPAQFSIPFSNTPRWAFQLPGESSYMCWEQRKCSTSSVQNNINPGLMNTDKPCFHDSVNALSSRRHERTLLFSERCKSVHEVECIPVYKARPYTVSVFRRTVPLSSICSMSSRWRCPLHCNSPLNEYSRPLGSSHHTTPETERK